jgi:hypothetical protein
MGTGTEYPGERFGLPERGRGSVAGYGRRTLGWLVDGAAMGLANYYGPWSLYAAVFVVDLVVLPALWGRTGGQALVWLRMVQVEGEAVTGRRRLTVGTAFSRGLVLWSLAPYLVFTGDDDRRLAHDRWMDTAVVRA